MKAIIVIVLLAIACIAVLRCTANKYDEILHDSENEKY
jgi:hypothetical protein